MLAWVYLCLYRKNPRKYWVRCPKPLKGNPEPFGAGMPVCGKPSLKTFTLRSVTSVGGG